MTKYTIDESVIEGIEAMVGLLNSKDLNDVSRANKAFPALIASMRMCPEEPTFNPQKGFAHAIYNTEIVTLKNMLYQYEKGTDLLNEIGDRPKLKLSLIEDTCQCGLPEPCSQGDSLIQGQLCSAGYASCYPMSMEKRKHIKRDRHEVC